MTEEKNIYGWKIGWEEREEEEPARNERDEKGKKTRYDGSGIPEIFAGAMFLILGLMLFIDGYGRYTNPLYPLVSESVKSEIAFFLFTGLIGIVLGFILIVLGFIKYSKEDRRS